MENRTAASTVGTDRPKRPKTGGRVKGTPNKVTSAAKEAFSLAFTGMGGVHELTEWGKTNRTEFYKLFARLIPVEQQHSGPDGSPIPITWPLPRSPLDQ
ncbi:MAG: hypothetical protein KGL39_31040 [Patescibacteria group bacterium]|nr:hypothetical protein [Patescibacteria group bacterium]